MQGHQFEWHWKVLQLVPVDKSSKVYPAITSTWALFLSLKLSSSQLLSQQGFEALKHAGTSDWVTLRSLASWSQSNIKSCIFNGDQKKCVFCVRLYNGNNCCGILATATETDVKLIKKKTSEVVIDTEKSINVKSLVQSYAQSTELTFFLPPILSRGGERMRAK